MLRLALPLLLVLALVPPPAAALGATYSGSVEIDGPGLLTPDCREQAGAELTITTALALLDVGRHCTILAPIILTWEYHEGYGYELRGTNAYGWFILTTSGQILDLTVGPCAVNVPCVQIAPTRISGFFDPGTIIF